MGEKRVYRVAGREYVPAGPCSIEHDVKTIRLAAECGFLEPPRPGEAHVDYARRKVEMMNRSGDILRLVGYAFMPKSAKPEDWTEEMAEGVAREIGRVVAPHDRAVVDEMMVIGASFFLNVGRQNWKDSPSYSETMTETPVPAEEHPTPAEDGVIGQSLSSLSRRGTLTRRE